MLQVDSSGLSGLMGISRITWVYVCVFVCLCVCVSVCQCVLSTKMDHVARPKKEKRKPKKDKKTPFQLGPGIKSW